MTTHTRTLSILGDNTDLPFLLRTGKVQQNASDKGEGEWSIPHGGFTSQLKYRTTAGRFKGQLAGYTFYKMPTTDGLWSGVNRGKAQIPHIWVFEFDKDANGEIDTSVDIVEYQIWLVANEGDGKWFSDLSKLKNAAVAAINAESSLTYRLGGDNDDLVCTADKIVYVSGPVPWVCGWGYIKEQVVEPVAGEDVAPASPYDPKNWLNQPGLIMPFSRALRSKQTPASEQVLNFQNTHYNPDFAKIPYVAIKTNGEKPVVWNPENTSLGNATYKAGEVDNSLKKNRSEHAYYWQCDLRDAVGAKNYKTLYDAPANPRLRYYQNDGSTLAIGDVVGLGEASAVVTAEGASTTAGIRYFEVKGKKYGSSEPNIDNIVFNMPIAVGWMTGWFDYYAENQSQLPEGTELSSVDPYPLVDASMTESRNPVKIFRQLLGKPADTDEDAGIPPAYKCTSIADLFGYSATDRKLIDFAKLKDLIAYTKGLNGVTYTMDIKQETGDTSEDGKELNILQMLYGICITHGIRMVWKYSEAQRSWILSFKRDSADTLTQAINAVRVINDSNYVIGKPFQINGGNFRYAGIKAEYKRSDGGKETFNIKDPSGMVQHSIGAKVLEIKDDLTVLDNIDRTAVATLIKQFGALTNRLALISHKIKLDTILPMAAKMIVGDNIAIDLEALRNPKSGRQNDGEQAGQVEMMTIDLGPRAKASCEITMSKLELKGISPAMYVNTWTYDPDTQVISVSGLATDPANNDFAPVDGGLTDLATFGSFSWDEERGTYARESVGTADYRIIIAKRGLTGLESLVSYWTGQMFALSEASIAAGTCNIFIDDGTGFADMTSGTDQLVLMFAPRDDANLHPEQYQYYGFLGDKNGLVYDSNDVAETSITAGG